MHSMTVRADHVRPIPTTLEFNEFTDDGYGRLLDLVGSSYRFIGFGEASSEAHVLWRHDIDFSVHRAVAMARTEAQRSLLATYFVLLRSPYYNALERQVADRLKEIASLGHRIGLHFELSAYEMGATEQVEQ